MSKQYGLIIPGQQKKAKPSQPPVTTKPSIFDESSDSDDNANAAPQQMRPKPGTASGGPSLTERRVARLQQEKALAEDPTIFQYDELYDELDDQREAAKQKKASEPRKPKYIGRLMEHAERRKLENELRIERQVQKDRDAEGEMYKDKETYVTSAYRKKLESIRQLQEQEQRDEYLETIGDVTKQKDLDGFYRHLYEQKLGTQQPAVKPATTTVADDTDEGGGGGGAYKPITNPQKDKPQKDSAAIKQQRSYRRRHSSDDEQEAKSSAVAEKTKTTTNSSSSGHKATHLTNNIDADSDFSIDDDSSGEDDDKHPLAVKSNEIQMDDKKLALKLSSLRKVAEDEKEPQLNSSSIKTVENNDAKIKQDHNDDDDDDNDDESSSSSPPPAVAPRPKIDRSYIWKKRTVGEVYEAALERYEARKRARQG